ncbi:hypothetical protein [Flavobacterium sp. CS20]|uniref:hypothetical protein n=1 Tax=Flavobacterium sp. CS20 TaxID=2775246 RepID=UPI001B39ED26|nr:hypothetical protein [Flavobacterium sp. CS20]QTY27318.1 hypothetical protein IGB25_01675 [Flavobacterium sp. CS20]
MYDSRLGKFLSLDPLSAQYPHNSPFAFSENRVIDGMELEGLEYLDSDASLIEVFQGVPFLKLENFSGPFRGAFKKANPNWQLIHFTPKLSSPLMVSEEPILFAVERPLQGMGSFVDKNFSVLRAELKTESVFKGRYSTNGTIDRRTLVGKNIVLQNKATATSTPRRVGPGKGGGIFALVDLLNFGLETYTNTSIALDKIELNIQVFGKKTYDKDSKRYINEKSALSKATEDVLMALENGLLGENSYDIGFISEVTNVVLFGGNGTESSEAVRIGREIIKTYSSEEAKNRLNAIEFIETIQKKQTELLINNNEPDEKD